MFFFEEEIKKGLESDPHLRPEDVAELLEGLNPKELELIRRFIFLVTEFGL